MTGWVKLHRKLLDDPVWLSATSDQKVVLMVILLLADHAPRQWVWNGQKFQTLPGQLVTSLSSLATKAGVSVQSVRSAIARFGKFNFLTNESTKTGRLISIKNWDTYQSAGDTPNKAVNKDPTKTQQLTRSKELKKESISSGFESFWQAYPKKQGKKQALKVWGELPHEEGLQSVILSALENQKYSTQWQQDNGQYIPLPASWLNQHRWEDEIDGNVAKNTTQQLFGGMKVY